MSKISKSPRKVALAAYRIAKNTLPDYNHRFSPKKFTQPQIFVCLVLKIFFKTDYRGIVAILDDSPDLCKAFGLCLIPHFTTLQKASRRLLSSQSANKLLESTVRIIQKNKKIKLAAVDSTGLEARHISKYFVRRKRVKQLEIYENTYYSRWPKLGISCDCSNHMVLSAITVRGPGVDINQFERIVAPAAEKYNIDQILADAGYDSESNHRFARDRLNIKSIIPPKHGRPTLISKPLKGKYREMMRKKFDKKTYGQRWQVETVMSMIKRNQGDCLRSTTYQAQNREMMLKVLTHNIGIILFAKELFYRAFLTSFPIQAKSLPNMQFWDILTFYKKD
jgi:Transposase DDE domain